MSPADRALAIVGGTFGGIGLLGFALIFYLHRLNKKIDRLRHEEQKSL